MEICGVPGAVRREVGEWRSNVWQGSMTNDRSCSSGVRLKRGVFRGGEMNGHGEKIQSVVMGMICLGMVLQDVKLKYWNVARYKSRSTVWRGDAVVRGSKALCMNNCAKGNQRSNGNLMRNNSTNVYSPRRLA